QKQHSIGDIRLDTTALYSGNLAMCWLRVVGIAMVLFAAASTRADDQPARQQEPAQQQQQTKSPAKEKHQKPYGPKEPTPIRDASNQTEVVGRSYELLKQQHIVMQKRDYSCGAAAVATIARFYWGDNVDEDLFLRALDRVLTDQEIIDRIKN